MSAEINQDLVSPWWPCPECGGIYFDTTCVFERGQWVDDELVLHDSGGKPSAIAGNVSCRQCGHELNIARHYDWPIVGEGEMPD